MGWARVCFVKQKESKGRMAIDKNLAKVVMERCKSQDGAVNFSTSEKMSLQSAYGVGPNAEGGWLLWGQRRLRGAKKGGGGGGQRQRQRHCVQRLKVVFSAEGRVTRRGCGDAK